MDLYLLNLALPTVHISSRRLYYDSRIGVDRSPIVGRGRIASRTSGIRVLNRDKNNFCRRQRTYLLNPYDSSESLVTSTPSLECRAASSPTSFAYSLGSILVGAVYTGLLILLQWCVLDYVTVRVLRYPEDLGTYDWTFIGSPILPLLTLLFFRWISPRLWTLERIVAMTVAGWLVAGVLIATIGIGYHFWIGGTL